MQAANKKSEEATLLEIKKEKKAVRRALAKIVFEKIIIYLAVVCGVLLTESILDIERSQELAISFSWMRVVVSAIVAMFFMYQFEVGTDKIVGKKRRLFRRVSHAFSQGAALRGMIEWLFLLFTLTR